MYERIMFTLHLTGFFGVLGTILTLGAQLRRYLKSDGPAILGISDSMPIGAPA